MRILYPSKLFFGVILLFTSCTPAAQKQDNTTSAPVAGTWKKTVTRDIDMSEKADTLTHHLTDQSGDTVLFQMLVNAVKSGKLTAYNNIGAFFANKLSPAEINDMMATKTDTIVVTDPVTRENATKVITRDFQYSGIHKYRILEEWGFDPVTGKTEIQITGIAPLMELYTQNISGMQHAMFWLRYEDARGILASYEQLHPDNTLASHIWSDYFQSDVKPDVQK